jgi:hypothetical protein
MSNNTTIPPYKKTKTKDSDDDLYYNIIEGSSKYSDVDTFSLLIPQSAANRVHEALVAASNQHHEWSITEDVVSLELISELPTCLAHSVGTVPESLLPFGADGNTEEEVLNLLLTGGSLFPRKYVVLEIMDGKYRENSILVAVELTKAEHMVVYERARELKDDSYDAGESCYIGSVGLWERSAYLIRFGPKGEGSTHTIDTKTIEATDRWIEDFLESSADRNPDNWDEHDFLRATFY